MGALEASATPNMDSARTVTSSGVSQEDVCEDAMVEFSSNVNGFMEAKFEVILAPIVTYQLIPCHRGKMAARNGMRTPPPRIQRS